jgi:hypothetical protein
MATITLGQVTVNTNPAAQIATTSPTPNGQKPHIASQPTTLEQAQQLADFPIWQPRCRPAVLELAQVYQLVLVVPALHRLDISALAARRIVGTVLHYRHTSSRWLVLQQIRLGAEQRQLEMPRAAWEGTIRGRPAAFFTQDVPIQSSPTQQRSILKCLWEHQGFLLELQGPNLSQAEAMFMAQMIG